MSYTVEKVNDCTKKLAFSFETLDLSTEIKAALVKKQKTVNLKGFRKGKAPLGMVEKLYRPQVESEALNQFILKKLFDAVDQEKLRVVGQPSLENMNYEAGKSVSFDAVVEVFPEIKDLKFPKDKFSKGKVAVTDEDLQKVKDSYLGSKSQMEEVKEDLPLKNGQTAVLNFQGEKENGERPEEMKGEDYLLEIGSDQFIPGFEEGMIGMKKGEKKDIHLSFPEDYHAEDLKGAKVKFEVELLEIKEKKVPDFTDELAKEFGYDSVADFEEKNKKSLQRQKEVEVNQKLQQEILDKFIEINPFDIPQALVEQQKKFLKEDVHNRLKSQGFPESMMEEYFNKWEEDLVKKALFQVRSGLILDHLGKKYEIEATQEDFDAKLSESANLTNASVDELKKFYESRSDAKNNLMYAIREEKTFARLEDELGVTEK